MAARRGGEHAAVALRLLGGGPAARRAAAGPAGVDLGRPRATRAAPHRRVERRRGGRDPGAAGPRLELRIAQQAPEDGFGVFTYVQPPSGLLVELASSAVRPMFERWFAGGELR